MVDPEPLVERIYEAAMVPEQWPSVLEQLGRTVQTPRVALLMRRNDSWVGHTASPPAAAGLADYLATDVPARAQTTARLLAADRAGFLSNMDLYSAGEWEREPFRAEWARPRGWNHCAAMAVAVPSGDFLTFHAQRLEGEDRFTSGDIATLDRFRPHLARAGMLAVRLRLQRLQTATDALAAIGLPAAAIDREGRALAANASIEALDAHVRWRSQDRLCLVDARADNLLREAVTELAAGSHGGRSFAAHSMAGDAAVVHVVPAVGRAGELLGGAIGLVVVTAVAQPGAADIAVIRGLFDLSAGEARVARAIALGKTVDTIAGDCGVSREAVHAQLKAVLAKTRTSRQAEAASLLAGLPRLGQRAR